MRRFAFGCFSFLMLTVCLNAQSFTTSPCTGEDANRAGGWIFNRGERVCELRRITLPLVDGQLSVAGTNGGIEVTGEDRKDIALEARVKAQGSSHDDAMALLHRIEIDPHGTIHANGPSVSGWSNHSWTVDYRLRVPRHVAAQLHTQNGGIELTDLDGSIHAQTTNGGLSLRNLAGDVHATTVNGGLEIALAGNQWHGKGLYANSTNGGVDVKAPSHYSAHLVADNVNGGIDVDFPITVEGKIRNHLDTNLGSGGATLQFQTVNGGISVAHD